MPEVLPFYLISSTILGAISVLALCEDWKFRWVHRLTPLGKIGLIPLVILLLPGILLGLAIMLVVECPESYCSRIKRWFVKEETDAQRPES